MSPTVKNSFLHFEKPRASIVRSASCPQLVSRRVLQGRSLSMDAGRIPPTTMMIRNIPTRFTSISFISLLFERGFVCDFFYLPMDFRTGKNMGYCFVNFLDSETAKRFTNVFDNTRLGSTLSSKVLSVAPSNRQGLQENVALFRNSDLLSSNSLPYYKPLVRWGECGLVPLCPVSYNHIMTPTIQRYSLAAH